jgi:hypothetical protein
VLILHSLGLHLGRRREFTYQPSNLLCGKPYCTPRDQERNFVRHCCSVEKDGEDLYGLVAEDVEVGKTTGYGSIEGAA